MNANDWWNVMCFVMLRNSNWIAMLIVWGCLEMSNSFEKMWLGWRRPSTGKSCWNRRNATPKRDASVLPMKRRRDAVRWKTRPIYWPFAGPNWPQPLPTNGKPSRSSIFSIFLNNRMNSISRIYLGRCYLLGNSWPVLIYSAICICMWLVPIVIIIWWNELFRIVANLGVDWSIAVSLVYEVRWSARSDEFSSIEYVLLSMGGRKPSHGTFHRTSPVHNSAIESGILMFKSFNRHSMNCHHFYLLSKVVGDLDALLEHTREYSPRVALLLEVRVHLLNLPHSLSLMNCSIAQLLQIVVVELLY